jgi:ABC-2 type transport system permease protein
MNWYGLYTLFGKEVWRFMKVAIQTILTPIVIVLLYLLVFASVLEEHVEVYQNVSYLAFLVPGLIMMSIIQNAFANSSSSLFQSKVTGSIIFILVPPLSNGELFLAFISAAVLRGILVGIGVWFAALWIVALPIYNAWILITFSVLGSAVLGALGIIAALWAEKWDHIAAFQNFVILPLTFLSGVFYRINALPDFWEHASYYNPFLYMIDGFRYGFIGQAEISIKISLIVVSVFLLLVSVLCLWLLQIGYKVRS